MSFSLADLFGTTPTLPGVAGVLVPAPAPEEGGVFAEALRAFRAEASPATMSMTAAVPAPADLPAALPAGARPLRTFVASLLSTLPQETIAELGLSPDAVQRLQSGMPTGEDIAALAAALERFDATNPQAAEKPAGTDLPAADDTAAEIAAPATDGNGGTAGTVLPTNALQGPVPAGSGGDTDMAIRIAEERPPYIPPAPDRHPVPQPARREAPAPLLVEGRASAAGAPPAISDLDVPARAEAPQVSRAVLDALAPRAPMPTAGGQAAAGFAPPAAGAAVPAAAVPSPQLPPQVRVLASTPHVTSVQAAVAAEAAPPAAAAAAIPQAPNAPQAQAPAAPAETPAATTAAAPAAASPTPAAPVSSDIELTGGTAVEENAADAALSALVKDKPDAKPDAPQARPAVARPEDPEIPAAKAAAPDPEAKARDGVKPEPQPQAKSASAEKPSAPEPRAPQNAGHAQQLPPPAADRVILADASARAIQQTAQHLPAAAIPQIASEMAMRVRQGHSRFEIRLDPPELGRVDVRIEVDSDGRVHSRLMVEKSETLDLLKADQRALERALHDAGFKSDQNSLSFSLRDERGGHSRFEQQKFLQENDVRTVPEEDPARLAAELAYRAPMRGSGGIDLRV